MDFPIIIIRVSPLSFLGASGVMFEFYSIFDENSLSKQYTILFAQRIFIENYTVCSENFHRKLNKIQTSLLTHSAASHLGLFC